ncbi:MAG: helix-turn-helix transcriptional regulator [Solobacterium sp.]|nr:helix-turn-helix transcriptional regulator [Solobacterium sp.]
MDQIRIGRFLQDLRKEKGLTQEQLADKTGVARRTVSRWETGTNLPDLDILIELSDFYDVDLRDLLNGERKIEKMDKEMEETVLKVAEYSNSQKEKQAKVITVFFIAGIIALAINQVLLSMDLPETFASGFFEGVTAGIALGAMILGILYTTGAMMRVNAFKQRLLKRNTAQ